MTVIIFAIPTIFIFNFTILVCGEMGRSKVNTMYLMHFIIFAHCDSIVKFSTLKLNYYKCSLYRLTS